MKNIREDVMHLIWIFLTAILLMAAAPVVVPDAGMERVASIGEGGLRGFFLAIGDYYRVPQREVGIIRDRGIPSYEVPVVLFLAKRTHVGPEIIMDLRLSGYTWLDITLRFGLSPEIFYVPVGEVIKDSLYGRAYGCYRHKSKKEWKRIVLSDDEIINLVNLKLMSEYYGYPPAKIIKMRSEGREFVSMIDEIRKERGKIDSNHE